MHTNLIKLKEKSEILKSDLSNHPVFGLINSSEDLHVFMKTHVYAVWDFMSLLKALQQELTCTSIPWFPKGSADTRYLINEIVLGEESDVDENGSRCSHFELYLNAMKNSGCPTSEISNFMETLKKTGSISMGFLVAGTAEHIMHFVKNTFKVIQSGKAHIMAAVFTFGREDLIPGMFHTLVSDLNEKFPDKFGSFKYYLERHIEVDGEHHSHLALEMTAALCGEDEVKWKEAEEAVMIALEHRKLLWDGILACLSPKQPKSDPQNSEFCHKSYYEKLSHRHNAESGS